MLVGCQPKDVEDAENSDVKGEEILTVNFSYPPCGYDSNKEDTFWKKHIAEFEKENPNIKINLTIESWDNVYTK